MEWKAIKPYHLFQHQSSWYVINVEGMFANTINEAAARMLEVINAEPVTQPEPLREELRKLGLLAEGRGQIQTDKKGLKKEPFPVISMCLFLTQSCNLKCVYCYGDGGGYGTGGSMEEKTALQAVNWLLEQAGKIKKLHIGFFGGEPFINFPLMKAVVEHAEKKVLEMGKKIDFHTTTNATLLNDERIAFIKEHQIATVISFDGPKEIQDAQRPYANGEGSYDTTVPKIKKLLAAVPETPGHAVIVGNTEPELVKEALQEIGFSEVSIVPASQSLFAGESDRTKKARTQRILQALEKEAENWISLTKSRNSEALKILKARNGLYQGLMALLHNTKKRYACGAGLSSAAVSCAGDIYLCHRFVGRDEYKLGNVFERDLNREEYQKSPVTGSGVCVACFAKYYCAGGCKHDNVGSSGSVAIPSEDMCRLRCRELELAAVIACRLDTEDKKFLIEREIFTPKPCPLDF
ncbi:MAG: radical SAM protein [Peptococcaceae bacterium BICA1-7]|nr:MAG: radical SAM protein [Peptococcaceae bacterium BICA1-7]HBV97166.1 nif11-like peptide radical SAM maturase [Desulfotomaculum sp.]